MSESGMRSKVVSLLTNLDAIAVENPALPGTPDVNYAEGWIELKWLRNWPKQEETIVTLDHYTQQQRVFAVKRRMRKGQCFFLLQCKREWLLLDGAIAAKVVNFSTRQQLIENCVKYWPQGINKEELIECLTMKSC